VKNGLTDSRLDNLTA